MAITIPNEFTAGTTIVSDDMDENFAEIAAKALDKTGDTITGNISVGPGVTIDGRDISADLDQAVKTTSSPTHAALTLTGGLTAGSGTVGIINSEGKIPAITSVYFADLSGAALTGASSSLNRDVTAATVANTTTETTVFTYTLPGGTLSTNRSIRLSATGSYFNQDTTRSLTFKVKLGSTTVFSHAAAVGVSNNGSGWTLETEISGLNATNAQVSKTYCFVSQSDALDGTGAPLSALTTSAIGVHTGIAEDSTTDKDLVVTLQWSAASAALSATCKTVQVYLV